MCSINQEIFDQVCQMRADDMSMEDIRKILNISNTVVRKILVTAGMYRSETLSIVTDLRKMCPGITAADIAKTLGKSAGYITSLIPYEKGMYNAPCKSKNAQKLEGWRKRKSGSNL